MRSYCVKQKKVTECTEPSGYKTTENGRLMFFCTCAECGIKKTKFVKKEKQDGKRISPFEGAGILSDVGNTAAELFLTKGVPYLGKKAVEMGRYYTSEMLRDPKLQKKAIDYALDKLNPAIHNVGSQTLNQLSTKIRPNKKYTTNRKDLDGAGVIGDIFDMTKKVSDITGKIIGGPTKKTLDDWWSGDLAKRAFSPKLGYSLVTVDQQLLIKMERLLI